MKLYKPKIGLIIEDLLIIFLNVIIVLGLFPLTSRTPFQKYLFPAVLFIIIWVITSYLFGRYGRLKIQSFYQAAFKLFYTSLINFSLFAGFIVLQHASPFSQYVLFAIMAGIFITQYLMLFLYFALRYATYYDVPITSVIERENAVLIPSAPLTDREKENRIENILKFTDIKTFELLKSDAKLLESSTKVLHNLNHDFLNEIPLYKYDTFIETEHLNCLRGINKMFFRINEKLPDEGRVVVRYVSKSTLKKNIYRKYPILIRDAVYVSSFIFHRLFSKFFLTKRLYFDLTQGKHRILSKTEVLGRLICCGFEIEKDCKRGGINVVIAKRVKQPEVFTSRRNYGPLIKLTRFGKNKNPFYVYKFRTMHPYAEFLQEYVFEHYSLQSGGKFNRDIRVATLGKVMRKYWLDELPMIINLLKGEMKLIGVRPLSNQYFNLYSAQLQEKRVRFKPGLLPPFYADLPKTLEEIQASEMKYLNQCEEKGVFITDTKYFFLILKNIFIKKVRSA